MDEINMEKMSKYEELDFNMILDVPEEIGKKISYGLQKKENAQEMKIEIEENPSNEMKLEECRKMIFKINGERHPITILDLPCIIEANKTIDYKTFYKSSDISQMFYVHDAVLKDDSDLKKFDPFKDIFLKKKLWRKDLDHKYKLKDGLCKCTKNIRKIRFKKKIKLDKNEILEVAKKLKNIIDTGNSGLEKSVNQTHTENDDDNNTNVIINTSSKGNFDGNIIN